MDCESDRPIVSLADKDAVRRKLDYTEDDLQELSVASGSNVTHLQENLCRGSHVSLEEILKFVCVDMLEMDWRGEEIYNIQVIDFTRVRDVLELHANELHVYFVDGSQMFLSQQKLCQWFPPETSVTSEGNIYDFVKCFRFKKPVVFDFLKKYFQMKNLVETL